MRSPLRKSLSVAVAASVLAIAQASCFAQTAPPATGGAVVATDGGVRLAAGLESAYVLQGSDGQTYMVIDLAAGAAPTAVVRPSMAVALVIDRSGSMGGDKIANARAAASSFIGSMADGDVISIFQYDDVVEQLAPPTVVGPQTRGGLLSVVAHITPRGSTNLHGGLVSGIGSLTSAVAERPVRRVVLISDGLANVGPSSPAALGAVAAGAAARGVSVTTIGVGLDYDEAVMGQVAIRSGGRFYHMQEPAQLAGILQNELNALGSTVARGVLLELVPSPGVQILGATGADMTRHGNRVRLAVGDMLGEQSRQIVLPVRVPTAPGTERVAARVNLRYRPATGGTERSHEATVAYDVTRTEREVAAGLRPELAVAVERHRASEARLEAARLVAAGDTARAADALQRRAVESRARARSVGGRAGAAMDFEAESLASGGARVSAARSAPAARAVQLELNDEALEAQGF